MQHAAGWKRLFLVMGACSAILPEVCVAATIEYSGYAFRDPFESQLPKVKLESDRTATPIEEAPANVDFLKLSGVLWNSDEPRAIINGRVVNVGGMVEGAEVVSIGQSRVDVRYKGKEFTLTTGSNKGGQL